VNGRGIVTWAAIFAVAAALILVLDNRFDLGGFHDLADFIAGILIGVSAATMVFNRMILRAQEDADEE